MREKGGVRVGRHANSGSFVPKDWSGFRNGKLVAIRDIGERANGGAHIWLCRCDCGNEIKVASYRIGKATSCGCDRKGSMGTEKVENLEGEEWRPISGFDKYFVSDKGRVKSLHHYVNCSERIMKQREEQGYMRVGLMNGKNRVSKRVHRLVAEAFIENPERKPEVNHKDGDKKNNCVENLEWVTPSENTRHAFENGLKENVRRWAVKMGKQYGWKSAAEKRKTPVCAINIETGEKLFFVSQKEAAEKIGVSQGIIWDVLNGKRRMCRGYGLFYVKEGDE